MIGRSHNRLQKVREPEIGVHQVLNGFEIGVPECAREVFGHVEVVWLDLYIALGDLFGVVERVAVQKGPNEVSGDPTQNKLKVCVLEGRVVTGLIEISDESVPTEPLLLVVRMMGV